MPLPDSNTDWPPKPLAAIRAKQAEWEAWWTGDTAALANTYRGQGGPRTRPSQLRGGIVGTVARWFWGAPQKASDEPRVRLHVPLAADICQASSDLLFSDPPQLTSDDDATSEQLTQYLDDGMGGALASAAEVCAALGGIYLRATWDDRLQRRAFLSTVDADAAYPEFLHGRLLAVTFWWRLAGSDDSKVWRHVERHELQGGIGVIEHGLYEGTGTTLGRRKPLAEHPATAPLAATVNSDGQVSTGTPGLDVAYVPNNQPAPLWRQDPIGRHLGVSDLSGTESFLDSLDETYSNWMRDLNLAVGRLVIPEYMLEVGGPGKGATFDLDRQVYQLVNAAPSQGVAPQLLKFDMDVERYKITTHEWTRKILHSAGYSLQTFGEDETAGAATATEIVSKDRRTMSTRDTKIRLWQPALTQIIRKMLHIDRTLFGAPVDPDNFTVAFVNSLQDTPLQLAQTAQAMAAAQAASTQTRVQILHPDWDETQIGEEAARIMTELGIGTMADPLSLGVPVVKNEAEPPPADAVAR